MNWQPIETAPRNDLERVIVCYRMRNGEYFVEEARYDKAREEWWAANMHYTDAVGEPIYPTHWMPLPEPPQS